MMLKTLTQLAATGVLLASSLLADAEDKGPYDDAIKARQGLMQLYSFNIGILSAMAKEKIDYDEEVATEAANNLGAAANMGQSQLWPEGSDNQTEGNAENRAKPDIWETYPDIVEKSDALNEATAALAVEAGNGLDSLQEVIGDVGESCKGCHDDFREKDK